MLKDKYFILDGLVLFEFILNVCLDCIYFYDMISIR